MRFDLYNQVTSVGQNIKAFEAHDVQPPPAAKTHPKDAIVSKDPVPAAKGKPTNDKNHTRQLIKPNYFKKQCSSSSFLLT